MSEGLVEYQELMDGKIKELQINKSQLDEKLWECDNKDCAISNSQKLMDVLNSKGLPRRFFIL